MIPESKRGAGYFTLLLADRLADLNREVGRPVTLEELENALLYDTHGVPWSYLLTMYYRYRDSESRGRSGVSTPTLDLEGNPKNRYRVLHYAVRTRIKDALRNPYGRRWVIQHSDGTLERNPDPTQQPRVFANGQFHDWTDEVRRVSEARLTKMVKGINQGSVKRRFGNLTYEERVLILRRLTKELPADPQVLHNSFNRVFKVKDAIWHSIERIIDGEDGEAILALIHELTENE
jgi:hypothetical protein